MNEELNDVLIELKASLEQNQDKKLEDFQEQFNEMAIAIKTAGMSGNIQQAPKDELKSFLTKNFDVIKEASGQKIETKDMSITSFTGDAPRSYAATIAAVPGQPISFAQLIRTISIDNANYSYVVENAKTGDFGQPVELATKEQIDYNLEMKNLPLEFLAAYVRISKKMINSLSVVEDFIPQALRRDFIASESAKYYSESIAVATPSTLILGNRVERLTLDIGNLMALNYVPDVACVNIVDYSAMLLTAGPEGGASASYSLPGSVVMINGVMTLNGVAIIPTTWTPADKYLIMDTSYWKKVSTKGLSIRAFEQDGTNVVDNAITIRAEEMLGLAISRPSAGIYGDFTTIA